MHEIRRQHGQHLAAAVGNVYGARCPIDTNIGEKFTRGIVQASGCFNGVSMCRMFLYTSSVRKYLSSK